MMKHVFDFQEPYYSLSSETSQSRRENLKTTYYGIQSIKLLGPKMGHDNSKYQKLWLFARI